MIHDRATAHRLAGCFALRAGLDPFESSLDAGIADAAAGRVYGDATKPRRANPKAYALGFALGRFTRLEWGFNAPPGVAEALAVVARLSATPDVASRDGRIKESSNAN